MRIGILRNTFLPKSETFIVNQIRHYENVKAVVLTRQIANEHLHHFEGIKIHEASTTKFGRLLYTLSTRARSLDAAVTAHRLQLLHAHFGVDAVYGLPLARRHGIPLVATFHGYDVTRLPKPVLWPISWMNYYLHFNNLLQNGDLFLAVSNHIRSQMLQKGFPADKVLCHYTGIDVERITAVRRLEEKRGPSILAVGRLAEKKGFEYLIRGFAALTSRFPSARLRIIGEGPLEQHLKSIVVSLRCESSVTFMGFLPRDKVMQEMQAADIFSVPSVTASDGDQEGLPTVLLEAAACGLPIIGTINSGIPEAIIDGETGFLVAERNSEALTFALTTLLEDKSLRIKMGTRGREFVEDSFNIRIQSRKLEDIYKGLIL